MKKKFCKKKFAFLLFGIFFCTVVFGQSVTKEFIQTPLSNVLKEIERQTGLSVVYDKKDIDGAKLITRTFKDAPTETVLSAILDENMDFSIRNRMVMIHQKEKTPQQKALKTFSGIISDESGEPVIGAGVAVKGSQTGTITDMDGKFSIQAVSGATLAVSYIGYTTKEVKLSEKTDLQIVMQEDQKTLNEVVVVGYGTQSQKLVTTSISKLKMGDIDKGNDYNPIKMLQGRVSGVNISSSSGMPGADPNVIIRGVGSITGSSAPLYVVDGIPSEKYPRLNPNDIESMEVLKDASAAAIYGSRANTGVILITTKSGKNGKTEINVSGRTGFGSIAKDIPMANAEEYARTMQAAVDNYNAQMGTSLKLYKPEKYEDTNWVDWISRDVAYSQSGSISVAGGNDKTTFYTSYGYENQEGYLLKSNYRQNTLRAKFGHKINDIFKLNMNLAGAFSKQDILEEQSTALKIIRTAREEPAWYSPYQEDGSYKVISTMLTRHNPIMLINEEDWTLHKTQLSGVFSIDIRPFKGFKYTPSVSLYSIYDDEWKKLSDRHDARKNTAGWSALTQQKDQSTRYVIDNIFSYNFNFDKLTGSAMAGHSFEKYEYEQFGARSENYANDAYPSSSFNTINAGASIYPNTINFTGYALESYLGRIALNWDNKYIFNASVRRDGSSRFSKETRYGNFPSASLAWRISNEDFYKFRNYINDLKLRISWGMTGSMAGINDFAALSLVKAGGSSYNGIAGFQISQDAQRLTWEKSSQYNVGADVELLNARVVFNLDAFYQKTTDLLYNKPVYATTGNSAIQANIGSLANKGVEFGVNGKILTGTFKWNVGLNYSYVKNELLSLIDNVNEYIVPAEGSNLIGGTMHILKIGEPISSFYMLKMTGIYQSDEEVPAKLYAKGVRAGDVKYEDFNDDGDITDNDRQIVGKAMPDFFGGITSTMSYKGFDLSIFCQYSVGGNIVAAWKGINGSEGADHLGNGYSSVRVPDETGNVDMYFGISKYAANHYWNGSGTSNTTPRPIRRGAHTGYAYDYNVLTSTRYLEDASYFKIKTIALGYTLPDELIQQARINSLRFYLSIDNLFTFTKYSGYEPEASYDGRPGASNYGVDFGIQPALRTFLAGVSFKF